MTDEQEPTELLPEELPRRLPEVHPGWCEHCAGTGERTEFGITESCCYCGGTGEGKE